MKDVRIGCYGFGPQGHQIFGYIPPLSRARLTAIGAIAAERFANIRKGDGLPDVPSFDDFDTFLAEAECDLISLCTEPRADQYGLLVRALRAGKSVLAEKPMAMTMTELDELRRICKETGSRLYTMTGREEFLTWAERLADYYFDQPNFVPTRLRDHGCEIIGGLGLLLAVEAQENRPKAKGYQDKLKHVFDTVLAQGCNEDGMMYNHITRRDGGNGKFSDGWGYNYVGYLCYDMTVGRPAYREHVASTLKNLAKPLYDNYNWEGNYSIDGFADSIEGGIYLLNRVPVAEGFAWVDREMARSVTRSA